MLLMTVGQDGMADRLWTTDAEIDGGSVVLCLADYVTCYERLDQTALRKLLCPFVSVKLFKHNCSLLMLK